ncbi:DeoR/GlpR family DNA-binding transcription regulator [uncultured Microbacterium sp.]|uniref:DeoR/GlpR family DNA-binding transcription regulator n=1 Tax=uncultured Microbacterium sp. TaxID=191216 RepID=UPI0025DB83EE|nr:DeoR/GlpR family DNA-binding transcription regulator [uncultured Microbacterium sp.]
MTETSSASATRELSGDLNQHQRLSGILELLAEKGRISVHDAVNAFNVSGATIRRDLDHLASRQLLHRTRGGAVALLAYDIPLGYRGDGTTESRQRIGVAAASKVNIGDVVGITGGTIGLELARALAARPDLVNVPEAITVVTNAVNVAYELSARSSIRLLLTGGVVRQRTFAMGGDIAKETVHRFSFDHSFIEGDGLTEEGLSIDDEFSAEVQRAFVARSTRTTALVDSAHIGRRAFVNTCALRDIDCVTTDTDSPFVAIPGLAIDAV